MYDTDKVYYEREERNKKNVALGDVVQVVDGYEKWIGHFFIVGNIIESDCPLGTNHILGVMRTLDGSHFAFTKEISFKDFEIIGKTAMYLVPSKDGQYYDHGNINVVQRANDTEQKKEQNDD